MTKFTSLKQALGITSFFVSLSALMTFLTYDNYHNPYEEHITTPLATTAIYGLTGLAAKEAYDYINEHGWH